MDNTNIPVEMQEARRWILRDADKHPINPRTGKWKAWNNEADFLTYREVLRAQDEFRAAGLSFVTGGGWCGIDLDHVTQERGTAEAAQNIVQAVGSYAEVSPSGSGIHIFCKVDPEKINLDGRNPGRIHKNGKGKEYPEAQINISDVTDNAEAEAHIEIYHSGQCLTITGRPFGTVKPIRERTAAVLAMCARYFPERERRPSASVSSYRPEDDHGVVLDALNHIDVNGMGIEKWREIGRAAKAAGITYEEFDRWSAGDSCGHYNERGNAGWWKGWKEPGASPYTARTIFMYAQESGWDNPSAGAAFFETEAGRTIASSRNAAGTPQKAAGHVQTTGAEKNTPAAPGVSEGTQDAPRGASEAAGPAIYHVDRLRAAEGATFICETAADADAIEAAGGRAIAIGRDVGELKSYLTGNPTGAVLIAALRDPDANRTMCGELNHIQGVDAVKSDLRVLFCGYGSAEKAGELNPDELAQAVRTETAGALMPDSMLYFIDGAGMSDAMVRFKRIGGFGFPELDKEAGIYTGALLSIGGVPSIGKSSFALQLADHLSCEGHHVVYFSVEMTSLEMASKCFARRLYQAGASPAFNSLEIRQGASSPDLVKVIEEFRRQTGGRLSVVEKYNITAAEITQYVERYIRRNRVVPVVIVDFLQLLKPEPGTIHHDIRENLDESINALKQLAKNYDTAVIMLSSMNRSNNLSPADFEAFKETSMIESSSDFVCGIESTVMEAETFEDNPDGEKVTKRKIVKAAKKGRPRLITMSILKNRFAEANGLHFFEYQPAHDIFMEAKDQDADRNKARAVAQAKDILAEEGVKLDKGEKASPEKSKKADGNKLTESKRGPGGFIYS